MSIFKSIIKHYLRVKNGNEIMYTTHQYRIYHNNKYISLMTFSSDNLNTAKFLVERIDHYKIDRVITVTPNYQYEFVGTDQYGKPVRLIAKRAY